MSMKQNTPQRRIQLSDASLNSYGFRVLTSGIDLTQYERNPILLYMHERGSVIGILKDLRVEGDALTAEPVFDEASELSRRCKSQYEFGSLRMASVGFDAIEVSEDPEYLVEGQTRPTVTRCRLIEVSLVDIGANHNSIVLIKDGKRVHLSDGEECPLPLIVQPHQPTGCASNPNNNPKNEETMNEEELIALAVALGMSADAKFDAIKAKAIELKAQADEAVCLKEQLDQREMSSVERVVLSAITSKKIGEEKKSHFMELGKKIGSDELEKMFDSFAVQTRLSDLVGSRVGEVIVAQKKWDDLSPSELLHLRADDLSEYKRLYEEKYGVPCVIEE